MSGYTVEVRTAILTGGHDLHTLLYITKPDGPPEAWGFYPATDSLGNYVYGPGDVKREAPRADFTATSGPLPMTDARKLATLGAFLGEAYMGIWCWGTLDPNPHGQSAPILLQAFDQLTAYVDDQLMVQTQLKPLYDSIGLGLSP